MKYIFLSGTAVGTGTNSKKGFDKKIIHEIKDHQNPFQHS